MGHHNVVKEVGWELHVRKKQNRLKRGLWVDLVMIEGRIWVV